MAVSHMVLFIPLSDNILFRFLCDWVFFTLLRDSFFFMVDSKEKAINTRDKWT